MKKIISFVLIGFAALLLNLECAAETFQDGIVFAKIIGPYKSTPETAESSLSGKPYYFWTTVKVVDVKDDFAKELKAREIKLRTGTFEKALIGQTIPLTLTRVEGRTSKIEYFLNCSEINASHMTANRSTNAISKDARN